jgi:circadian clock protein KaiC
MHDIDAAHPDASPRVSTGIADLDNILGGGLTKDRVYLLEGAQAAARRRSPCSSCSKAHAKANPPLVALSETAAELREVARSHRWTLDGAFGSVRAGQRRRPANTMDGLCQCIRSVTYC